MPAHLMPLEPTEHHLYQIQSDYDPDTKTTYYRVDSAFGTGSIWTPSREQAEVWLQEWIAGAHPEPDPEVSEPPTLYLSSRIFADELSTEDY